ncbi:hypothetical protein Salat_2155300 [Sesamum alatum]|uniref:Uncharacterized protein n=1 Tax=Sesamum alatum TaxID=300844 RepID=A0AAE2CH99_9LAMI|nr:hypothetical protein Salat_2155300 [Sesamum alatum]
MASISPQTISLFIDGREWAQHQTVAHFLRRFTAVRMDDDRGPPPSELPHPCEANETPPSDFHPPNGEIDVFGSLFIARLSDRVMKNFFPLFFTDSANDVAG